MNIHFDDEKNLLLLEVLRDSIYQRLEIHDREIRGEIKDFNKFLKKILTNIFIKLQNNKFVIMESLK